MPFKTKRQKLAAAARRYTLSESLPINYNSQKNAADLNKLPQKDVENNKSDNLSNKQSTGAIEANYKYVKVDLIKIAVIASLIVTSQIIILIFKNKLRLPFLQGY